MANTKFEVDRQNLRVNIEHVFEAPLDLVWKAYTDPDLIVKWWGPKGFSTKIKEMDFRVGGHWTFVNVNPAGDEFEFNGEYKEIEAKKKIVDTFEFSGTPGHILTEGAEFVSEGDKTKVLSFAKYENTSDLEGMVSMGMDVGVKEGSEKLDELLDTLK